MSNERAIFGRQQKKEREEFRRCGDIFWFWSIDYLGPELAYKITRFFLCNTTVQENLIGKPSISISHILLYFDLCFTFPETSFISF